MHSGYPMMAQDVTVSEHLSRDEMVQKGAWGLIHELGHNHQWLSWTAKSMTETSNNWFSIYVTRKVCIFC
jgi:hypothetical protein